MKYSIITKKYNFKLEETKEYPVALPDTDYHPYFRITNGQLKIELFFCWDGSSVPLKGFFKAIAFGLYDGDRYCKEASLVHDPSSQMLKLGLLPMKYKEAIDRLYEKMCIEGGTKIIDQQAVIDRSKILNSDISDRKKAEKLMLRDKKLYKKLATLPAWAARRYWAVKHFGARTLKARYRPEKIILET